MSVKLGQMSANESGNFHFFGAAANGNQETFIFLELWRTKINNPSRNFLDDTPVANQINRTQRQETFLMPNCVHS